MPEDGSGFIAYQMEAAKPEANPEAGRLEAQPSPESMPKQAHWPSQVRQQPLRQHHGPPAPRQRRRNTELSSSCGTPPPAPNESSATCSTSRSAKTLNNSSLHTSSRKEEANGVYFVNTDSDGQPTALLSGKGKYQRLTWDEDNTQLAFTSDKEDAEAKQPKPSRLSLEPQRSTGDRDRLLTSAPGFRKEFVVSERGGLSFSLDGSHLFLGAAPPPEPERETLTKSFPPTKRCSSICGTGKTITSKRFKKCAPNRIATAPIAASTTLERKFVQLADATMENISPSNDGSYAIGI